MQRIERETPRRQPGGWMNQNRRGRDRSLYPQYSTKNARCLPAGVVL